ncbi:leucine-rich repeat receptor-like protein kinase PXC2 [Prunus persica]|uniref:leucine-rich repeat receptor-like protein kinase PXC2 n=1 Tax=Prunus persica TaxID=3760 RepID=UPI0009AB5D38|nr:leucine-rich repeat receptor-like protein kinase PXC2 [Prunus persica]
MDKAMRIVSVFRFPSIATISLCNGNLGVPCEQNERQALLMFKQDIKDPSNKLLSRVGEGDCCNWTGVVCDNLTGHVRELHLGNYYSDEYLNYSLHQENYLGGKVKNLHWLSGLSSLQNLDLSRVDLSKASDWFQVTNILPLCWWNIIWGTIPQWLYTCSNLESLSLYLNLLRGEISSCIGNLTAIVNLDSSANQLEGKIPNSLRNLCKLTVLDLSRNYFNGSVSEILGSLSRCSSGQMESLKLSTNDFSGPLFDQLGNFRHLRLLALSSNSISGPIPLSLGHLPFVEEASISEIHINGTLPKTTEILRQVLVATGFGSKQGAMRRDALSKVFEFNSHSCN